VGAIEPRAHECAVPRKKPRSEPAPWRDCDRRDVLDDGPEFVFLEPRGRGTESGVAHQSFEQARQDEVLRDSYALSLPRLIVLVTAEHRRIVAVGQRGPLINGLVFDIEKQTAIDH